MANGWNGLFAILALLGHPLSGSLLLSGQVVVLARRGVPSVDLTCI